MWRKAEETYGRCWRFIWKCSLRKRHTMQKTARDMRNISKGTAAHRRPMPGQQKMRKTQGVVEKKQARNQKQKKEAITGPEPPALPAGSQKEFRLNQG